MADRPFLFDVFRLNIVDEENASFDFMGKSIRTDQEVKRVLLKATESSFDVGETSGRTEYRWSIREYWESPINDDATEEVIRVVLGRSTLIQDGQTVTAEGFEAAQTTMSPPLSETVNIFFYMRRHLVAVEYRSSILHTQSWRNALHLILDNAARALEFLPGIRLEPVPENHAVLEAFRSFQRLTRLRVKLRIPNPELDRRTELLRAEMVEDGIREYTQDMKNPSGLNTNGNGRPFATATMAQAGYKEGEVILSGISNGRRKTIRVGNRAARGRIDGLRDYIRGIGANAKTNETKSAVEKILEEIDRVVESPIPPAA
jgi:hypothetical protein